MILIIHTEKKDKEKIKKKGAYNNCTQPTLHVCMEPSLNCPLQHHPLSLR